MGKILVIGYFNYPYQQASAVYVSKLRNLLLSLGHEVTILDKNRICYSDHPEYVIPVNKINSEFDDYFNYGKIKEYLNTEYSLVLLYNFSAYESFRIIRFVRKHKIKVGAISTEWKEWQSSNPVKAIVKLFDVIFRMKIINKKMDCNIVCSYYLLNYYKKNNSIYIPTMTDKGIKRDRRTNRNRQIRLIYIGIPSRKKENLSMFIHALMASTSCERYEFDLYGLTENDYQRIFKDKIDLKRWANIHFWGKVSQEEISNALRNSDYSVIFREDNRINRAGFPTKMGTSLSNDVPVLATPVGDIPKYIRNGLNGYLLPLDNNSLVAFLEQLPDLDEPEVDCDSLYWARYVGNLKCYEQLFN